MLRICQLITELRPAGAERGLYELCRRLDRRRFAVEVVALRGGEVADWLLREGIPVAVLGVRGKWDIGKVFALARRLRRRRFDILHTHLFHADLAGRAAAQLAGTPRLVHTLWTAEGRFRPWQFALPRLLAGQCDRLICLAESVRDFHARRSGLPRGAYTVIPWGIDAAEFAPDDDARLSLRRQWTLAPHDVLAAYVGRLEAYKGIDVLLEAIDLLACRARQVHFAIAGDGPRRAAVEALLARGGGGGRVRFLGFLPDVRALLSAADLYVMPSFWEGWGLAMGEAMAARLPAVATAVPAIRDLVLPGRTGLLVPPGDAAALADAIGKLAADQPFRLAAGLAARQRIVEHFPLSAAIAAHEKLYDEVAP
jgi:glycosyltransferase involved in cell wall biosynthesis